MGTRSVIRIYEQKADEKPLVAIYRQYDGYISGRGHELAEFLSNITLVNGFGCNPEYGKVANGPGCLAAQWIEKEKDHNVGNVYITNIEDTQEYNYEVRFSGDAYSPKETDEFEITVTSCYEDGIIFKGTAKELLEFKET